MKRVSFFNSNRSGNLLHIETEGAVVNIRVNLHNNEGQQVTAISIIPDRAGEKWSFAEDTTTGEISLIKEKTE